MTDTYAPLWAFSAGLAGAFAALTVRQQQRKNAQHRMSTGSSVHWNVEQSYSSDDIAPPADRSAGTVAPPALDVLSIDALSQLVAATNLQLRER